MAGRTRREWLQGTASLLLAGCASVRPPTPAANLDRASLNYAEPNEHFYAIVFASQRPLRQPATSHTWATVIRAVDRPGQAPDIDAHTISWLPATLEIRPYQFSVEPGINLGLHETILYAIGNRERVSMWGPYECRPSFYRRFLIQKAFIESGRVGYQCCDDCGESGRTGDGCCCIHAVSDMDPEYGRANYPLIWFGDSASEHIVERFQERGSLLNPEIEHEWVAAALGLGNYQIRRRHYHDRILDFPRVQPTRFLRGGTRG